MLCANFRKIGLEIKQLGKDPHKQRVISLAIANYRSASKTLPVEQHVPITNYRQLLLCFRRYQLSSKSLSLTIANYRCVTDATS